MFSRSRALLCCSNTKLAANRCRGKLVHSGKNFIVSKKLFENKPYAHNNKAITEPDSEWTSKLGAYHELLDVNNDGIVSIEDLRELTKRFSKINDMTEEQSIMFGKIVENLWYKHWGCIDPFDYVTLEKYLNYIQYVKRNDDLKNEVIQLLPYLFKTVDKDDNGHITQDEYNTFLECIGSSKKNDLIKSMGIINIRDNAIRLDDMIFDIQKFLFNNEDDTVDKQ